MWNLQLCMVTIVYGDYVINDIGRLTRARLAVAQDVSFDNIYVQW